MKMELEVGLEMELEVELEMELEVVLEMELEVAFEAVGGHHKACLRTIGNQ